MSQLPLSPGVYVEEVSQFDLALGTASRAVPVLLTSADSRWWGEQQQPVLIRSLQDYFTLEGAGTLGVGSLSLAAASRWLADNDGQVAVAETPGAERYANPGSLEALALRAYFANGGTDCYLCPVDQLEQVEALHDVSLVVQAGQPQQAIAGILNLCQPGSGRFALLDGPQHRGFYAAERLHDFLREISPTNSAALYYPWLNARWALEGGSVGTYAVPPSAVAAGLMMKTDSATGPWRAPGNLPLSNGLKPQVAVGNSAQQAFTSKDFTAPSVNMFREFPDRGAVLMGARTLSNSGPAWGYINVRRTFDRVERDLQQAMQRFLYEPNGPVSWEALRAGVENYLYGLFRQQAFAGDSPQTSYRVEIGLSTMTQQDIVAGIMRMRIGLAVVKPAEFVFLEFSQLLGGATLAGGPTLPEPEPEPEPNLTFEYSTAQIPDYEGGVNNLYQGGSLVFSQNGLFLMAEPYFPGFATRVLHLENNNWSEVENSISQDGGSKNKRVSINDDGSILAVSYPDLNKIYRNDNYLPDVDGMNGYDLAMSSDGAMLVSGAPDTEVDEHKVGAVNIYHENELSSVLTLRAREVGDGFGSAVAVSALGDRIVASAPNALAGKGLVATFVKAEEKWIEQDPPLTHDQSSKFGLSIAMNANGELLAVSGTDESTNEIRVFLFRWRNNLWESDAVINVGKPGQYKGVKEIDLSGDGRVLAVSSTVTHQDGEEHGVVKLYHASREWRLEQTLDDQDSVKTNSLFGASIALNNDGSKLAVGAPNYPGEDEEITGRIYLYDFIGQ